MNQREGKVVVKSPVVFDIDPETEIVMASFETLGLTGYGVTHDDAVTSMKELFHAFIHAHRENGTLREQLDRSQAEWYWLDEYPVDEPYEDTNRLFGPDGNAIAAIAARTKSEWETRTEPLSAAA